MSSLYVSKILFYTKQCVIFIIFIVEYVPILSNFFVLFSSLNMFVTEKCMNVFAIRLQHCLSVMLRKKQENSTGHLSVTIT